MTLVRIAGMGSLARKGQVDLSRQLAIIAGCLFISCAMSPPVASGAPLEAVLPSKQLRAYVAASAIAEEQMLKTRRDGLFDEQPFRWGLAVSVGVGALMGSEGERESVITSGSFSPEYTFSVGLRSRRKNAKLIYQVSNGARMVDSLLGNERGVDIQVSRLRLRENQRAEDLSGQAFTTVVFSPIFLARIPVAFGGRLRMGTPLHFIIPEIGPAFDRDGALAGVRLNVVRFPVDYFVTKRISIGVRLAISLLLASDRNSVDSSFLTPSLHVTGDW